MISFIIVDDEHLERILIKKSYAWEYEGFLLAGEAEDGESGLELFTRVRPELVITDINMPFMDGLEFARQVKQIAPDTEMVILTGYDEFTYAQKALNIGVDSYLLKPVTQKSLEFAAQKAHERILRHRKTEEAVREKILQQMISRQGNEDEVSAQHSRIVLNVLGHIDEHFSDPECSLKTIAQVLYVNDSYLSRTFKKEMKKGISEYILEKRLEKACDLLRESNLPNYEVAEQVGIRDPHYFGQCFKKQMKMTANQYRICSKMTKE